MNVSLKSTIASIKQNKVTYLILEGIDGVGKSALAMKLTELLLEMFGETHSIKLIANPTISQKRAFKSIKSSQVYESPLLDIVLFTSYIDTNLFNIDFSVDDRPKIVIIDRWYLSTLAYQFTNDKMHSVSPEAREFARVYIEHRIDNFIAYANRENGDCMGCIKLFYMTPRNWDIIAKRLSERQPIGIADPDIDFLKKVDRAYQKNTDLIGFIDYPEVEVIKIEN